MLYSRQNRESLRFLPDESRSLPPPNLTDPRILYLGFLGYCSGLLDNYIYWRPVLKAGLHRQLLYVTAFYFAGYFLVKRHDYVCAVRDRDMFEYVKLHPEDFPEEKEKKTYGELFEKFYPVR
ncbi:NADH dehydrogenase [ubiquinone] 1 subunit C2-like [Aotus nancymaae]|uniref:NADH dehydrogenase [ubiquinone] 1 subunit C2-like n=1 Tax=Aotus nancymaae TaxID=37293 RepID=UPI0030FEFF3E